MDLKAVGKMEPYWPVSGVDGRVQLPRAPWVLSGNEVRRVKENIKSFRTPTGLMRSLKTAFTKDDQLTGLKSHDWHKMCQVCTV